MNAVARRLRFHSAIPDDLAHALDYYDEISPSSRATPAVSFDRTLFKRFPSSAPSDYNRYAANHSKRIQYVVRTNPFMPSTRSSDLVLIDDEQARLVFDPVDTCNSPPSISFNINFTWSMPFQDCAIEHRGCWIEHDELNRFENDLSALQVNPSGEIVLRDMSEVAVLTMTRDGNSVLIRYHAFDTTGMGEVVFTIASYAQELSQLENRLRSYPKWW